MGKEFDALIIDTAAPKGAPVFDVFESDTDKVGCPHTHIACLMPKLLIHCHTNLQDKVSKFFYLGE